MAFVLVRTYIALDCGTSQKAALVHSHDALCSEVMARSVFWSDEKWLSSEVMADVVCDPVTENKSGIFQNESKSQPTCAILVKGTPPTTYIASGDKNA